MKTGRMANQVFPVVFAIACLPACAGENDGVDADEDPVVLPATIVRFSDGKTFEGNMSKLNVRMNADGDALEATFELGAVAPASADDSSWSLFVPIDVQDILDDGQYTAVLAEQSVTSVGVVAFQSASTGQMESMSGTVAMTFREGRVTGVVDVVPAELNATFESMFWIACSVEGMSFVDDAGITDIDNELSTPQCAPLVGLRK